MHYIIQIKTLEIVELFSITYLTPFAPVSTISFSNLFCSLISLSRGGLHLTATLILAEVIAPPFVEDYSINFYQIIYYNDSKFELQTNLFN